MNKKIVALSTLAIALAAPSVFAQSSEGQGFVRGEIGRTKLKESGTKDSVSDTSFSLRGGYMFNRNIGVEGFYTRQYDKRVRDVLVTGDNVRTKMSAFGVGAVGKVRFGDQTADTGFYGMGRAGIARTSLNYSYTAPVVANVTNQISYNGSNNSTNPYIGVGVGYDFSPNMGVSLNYDYLRAKVRPKGSPSDIRFNSNTVSAGFEYRF